MTLQPGQQIAHYRVVEKIGEGGMGQVYRAEDTRLGRSVAIKVLPEALVRDEAHLARFSREAQILASLSHPNIAGIHGLERAGDITALALELVEGETLADRIGRGPIPLDEAVRSAIQMAEALEAAHDKGIIHRDLKPGNIKFTLDGRVKVLDFGLAKAVGSDASSPDLTQSPTLTAMATREGVILGTASYMSPEQARGHAADRRSDIFSFGVVLVEMLTGRRPFGGATVSDTLADILRKDVDLDALPAGTPIQVRRLLSRCLAKDPKRRLQAVGDARIELQDALDAPELPVAPALSADGRRAVARNHGHLWVYDLEAGTRIRLTTETDNGGPLWDRDGRRIFFSSNRGGDWDLYVRSADGTGTTERLLERDYSQWAHSIASDGTLFFEEVHPDSGRDLWTMTPDGATEPFLVTPANETHGQISPDGRLLAYTSNASGRKEIHILPYPGPGSRLAVSRNGGDLPRWSRDGRTLYYVQGDAVMAAGLDLSGEPRVAGIREMFSGKFLTRYSWGWDVAPDGRFLMIHRGPGSVPDRINVVLNWTEELAGPATSGLEP